VDLTAEERAQMTDKVVAKLSELTGEPAEKLAPDRALADLGLDSVAIADKVLAWVNTTFSRTFSSAEGLRNVGDVIAAATGEPPETAGVEFKPVSDAWRAQHVTGEPARIPAGSKNIVDAFLRTAKLSPQRIAGADEILGEVTCEQLVTWAGIFATYL